TSSKRRIGSSIWGPKAEPVAASSSRSERRRRSPPSRVPIPAMRCERHYLKTRRGSARPLSRSSAEQALQVDGNSRERRHVERRAEIGLVDESVRTALRCAVARQSPAPKIHEPKFRDPVACVERQLRLSIEGQRRSGNLDEQQHIVRPRMPLAIEVIAPPQ